jgi:uncharacterized protein YodC (DUF2158 family)
MDSPAIQIGTVVQLRSGGPLMTVVSVSGESVCCEWFHGEKVVRGEFPVAALNRDTE